MISWAACSKRSEAPVASARDPREAALVLLQGAQNGTMSRAVLAGVVGELSLEQWAALGDALAPLQTTTRARILTAEAIAPERTAVDLEVALAGDGVARYRVQAERAPDGTWRVVSLDGPGIAWPAASAARDEGLSISAPPGPR